MKNLSSLLLFVILLIFSCTSKSNDNHSNTKQKLRKSTTAKWIDYPKYFTEFKKEFEREAEWERSKLEILDGKYNIGVGPYSFKEPNDGVYDYFCVDIEEPLGNYTSIVIAELSIDLKYVSAKKMTSKAEEIVKFDSTTNMITFDLGNSIFTCKLKPKDRKFRYSSR